MVRLHHAQLRRRRRRRRRSSFVSGSVSGGSYGSASGNVANCQATGVGNHPGQGGTNNGNNDGCWGDISITVTVGASAANSTLTVPSSTTYSTGFAVTSTVKDYIGASVSGDSITLSSSGGTLSCSNGLTVTASSGSANWGNCSILGAPAVTR